MGRLPLLLLGLVLLAGCADARPAPTVVPQVDLDRYAGTWYEIARFDHRFERGMTGVTATYTRQPDGTIAVRNAGRRDGVERSATAVAWVPDPAEPAKLRVRFFWPFAGDYWILGLDPDYRWAVVGHPSREYLWYLARTPTVTAAERAQLDAVARANGYDLGRLLEVSP